LSDKSLTVNPNRIAPGYIATVLILNKKHAVSLAANHDCIPANTAVRLSRDSKKEAPAHTGASPKRSSIADVRIREPRNPTREQIDQA
ncbi:MAG: hypothetical protein JW706_07115, partial [Opitutales bacterium]|nr:hypothetical protein [Opitutales bacterium]